MQVVRMPASCQEVLLSCLIFYTVRLLLTRMVTWLPDPPTLRAAPHAGPAAATGSVTPVISPKTRSEEAEAEGIKYEGYAEAIAAAQVSKHRAHVAGQPELHAEAARRHAAGPMHSLKLTTTQTCLASPRLRQVDAPSPLAEAAAADMSKSGSFSSFTKSIQVS